MCITNCDNSLKERSRATKGCGRKPNVSHGIGGSHIDRKLKEEWELADGNLGGEEGIKMFCAEEIPCTEVLRQKERKIT